jgi:hypothetical protein
MFPVSGLVQLVACDANSVWHEVPGEPSRHTHTDHTLARFRSNRRVSAQTPAPVTEDFAHVGVLQVRHARTLNPRLLRRTCGMPRVCTDRADATRPMCG